MNQKYFLFTIFVIAVVVLLILNSFLTTSGEMTIVLSGLGLALVHVLSGFYMSRWALAKPVKLFMSIVMGGMGIRLMLVAIVLVLMAKLVNIDLKLFVVAFGIYYLLFQIVEIYFINRGLQLKKVMKNS